MTQEENEYIEQTEKRLTELNTSFPKTQPCSVKTKVTENEQNIDRTLTESKGVDNQGDGDNLTESIYMDWVGLVEKGGVLPTPKEKIEWTGFKKAVRGWYDQVINPDIKPETRSINEKRFNLAKVHFQSIGYSAEPTKDGRLKLVKRDDSFYNSTTQEKININQDNSLQAGFTTGWDEYENMAA